MPMATLINPSQEEVRNFITQGEDNLDSGIYNDTSSGNYPTHGLGINFSEKTRAFLQAYFQQTIIDTRSDQKYLFCPKNRKLA